MGTTSAVSRRLSTLVLGLVAAAAGTGVAGLDARAEAPSLKWKFTKGDSFRYQMDQKTVTEIKANGQNIKTTVTQTVDTTWNVKGVEADGSAAMSQVIDRIKTRIESPFGAYEYDSKEEKPAEGPIAASLVPMLKALVGATFQYKISPRGELTDVQVPASLVEAMKQAGGAGAAGMFSEDGLKNMINESSLIIPDDISKPWTRQAKLPSPPIGTLILDKTYKYEGTEGNDEKIGLEVKVNLEPEANSKIESKFGAREGKGTFLFDNKAGRVVRSDVTEKVELNISFMNNQMNRSTETTSLMKLLDATKDGASK